MKSKKFALSAVVLASLTQAAWAAPDAGDRTFSLSGTGNSDQDFDQTSLGVSGELGFFQNRALELGVRQSANVFAVDDGNNALSGSTRVYGDYHFGRGPMLPYVGANIGGNYGENVTETFAAGPEVGVKYYAKDKTFVELLVEYQFLFDDADQFDDRFDDGAFIYTLGVGFNF